MWNASISAGKRMASALLTIVSATATVAFAAPPSATTTTLTLSAATVASPAVVTLTASVTGGASPLLGTVNFCDAQACQGLHILGTAQLTKAGTATFRLTPAIGTHGYWAQFLGTATSSTSTSTIQQTVTVTGLYPTVTKETATGDPSGYALTATVVGYASHPPVLAGNVTFTDTTNNNLLLGTVPLGAPAFAQTLTQAAGSPILIGPDTNPATIGVGDFLEDGKPDLAVVDAGTESISILIGQGNGTFTPISSPPIKFGTPPCATDSAQSNCSIVVGDFDNDGHADFAVTSGPDSTLSVFKGDGHGAFTQFSGSPISVGSYPEAVRIGDFNNDGVQDLVVANANDDTISILLGTGNGTFTLAGTSPTAGFPFFLAVADFNTDGNADVAVGNGRDNSVSIFLGNGDGTFTPAAGSPIPFPTNDGVCPIVVADFTGDGILDLAVANFGDTDPNFLVNGSVDILEGDGHGGFTQKSHIDFGSENPFAMVALDYDNDGITDLAISNIGVNTPGSVTVLKGAGNGTFSKVVTDFPVGSQPNDLVTADFNGDGHPDFAVPNSGPGDNTTTILLNTFTQTATATLANVILPGAGTHEVKATYPANADFDTSFDIIPLQGFGGPTTLTLTDSPSAQLDTLAVTFTAQLSFSPGLPPTGTISFFDSSATLTTVPVNAAGQAVFTTAAFGDGTHTIYAQYSGDSVFGGSRSAVLQITISDLAVARVGNNNTTIIPGTTVVYKLQVSPEVASTFLYPVTLSASGLPVGASATFSTPTLAAGSGAATVTMTVTTAKTALNQPPAFPFGRLPLALGFLLPLLGTRRLRKRLRHPFLTVLFLGACGLSTVAGLSGCAGAGLFAERKVPYAITVTATEGTPVYGSLQRSTGVPLAIQ